VTKDLQLQTLKEHGVSEKDLKEALKTLNNARSDYLRDPEMNQLTVYQRLDFSTYSHRDYQREGELLKSIIELNTLDLKKINLYDYYTQLQIGREKPLPLVAIAGSIS